MKRFWTDVMLEQADGGWTIALDRRLLKTPARHTLLVGERALGEAIAAEWRSCGETIDPRAMPLSGLANAAIDHVAPMSERFAVDLAKYADADLICYRTEHPLKLVEAQAAAWDPLLDWARQRFTIDFVVTAGIVPVPQPPAAVASLGAALGAASPFALAGLSPIITIGGSLITALALLEQAIDAATAWAAVSLDEQWQIEQWGADDEAVASLANRHQDFDAAARFLALVS